MTKKPFISELNNVQWQNWHKTKHVGGQVSRVFKPFNKYEDYTTDPKKGFVPGLAGIKKIVKQAAAQNMRVRGYGGRWSLNNIAFSNQYLVDCTELNYSLVGLNDSRHVSAQFQEARHRLAFVQCGVRVKQLNRNLQEKNLALPTSGASDGQTFVAAVSTGTHGSAHLVGAMQDYVRGIHLVISPRESVFIQPKSAPVVTTRFCNWLTGTRLIEDDALFYAALIGFGSFGFIHGLVIESEPIYLLERYVKQFYFDEVENAIYTLNMEGLGLPKGDKLPFHFETVLNPYGNRHGKSAFVKVLYKEQFQTPKKISEYHEYPKGMNDLIQQMGLHFEDSPTDAAGAESAPRSARTTSVSENSDDTSKPKIGDVGWFLQLVLKTSFSETEPGVLEFGFPGDQFHGSTSDAEYSPYPFSTTSLEIGVPLNRIKDAVKLIFEVTRQHEFPAPLALRYVKGSSAMLAFTRFSPITVTMEMPGIDNGSARRGHQAIFAALAASGIPHTFHWGQSLPLNSRWVSRSFGDDTIKSWKRLRFELLGEQGCRMFSNQMLETIGLHHV